MVDFNSFGVGKAPADRARVAAGKRWRTLQHKEAADAISATLKLLTDQQNRRVSQHMVSARLYGNLSVMGLAGMTLSKAAATQPGLRDRISYNVAQSCVDTAQSKMSKNKPKPLFLTSGGDFKVQRKAKKLNQFTDGSFWENNAYDMGIEAFRDGEVFGDGIIHVFARNQRVKWERVLASELWVDEVEAWYGDPRQMHRVKQVDRAVAEAFFGKGKLADADAATSDDGQFPNVADMVTIRESWHLPSGPKAKDGARIITIDGDALTKMEPWKHDFFPFARFRWCPRLWGYWSQGGVEQIQNIQLEVNKLLWVIQRSFHLAGTFKILIEQGSKIVTEHLNNDIGACIKFAGVKPEYVLPPIVQPEIFSHLRTLKDAAYEVFGINQLSANSQKPAGLNSGKALREYDDIGTDRFLTPGQRYQQLYLQLAKLNIATAKDIAEENGGHYEVTVPGRHFLTSMDWKDIDLEEDEYVMQCFPVSSLPSDPEGRLQTIQEYIQAGMLTQRAGKRALDFPDLDQIETLANAEEDYLNMILDRMVDDGIYTAPEPLDDLSLAAELAAEFYARGKRDSLDEERLELLRKFMSAVGTLAALATPAAAPMGPGMGAPQAAPMAPPTSDLIPNAPGGAPPVLQ